MIKNSKLWLVNIFFFLVSLSFQSIAGQVHALVKDNEGEIVEDAVVTAIPVDIKSFSKQNNKQIVDQIDKEFLPFIKVVYVNTLLYFPNKDDIRHHVYSFSDAKNFELPLYEGSNAPPVLMDKPGIVTLGCNIHDWMVSYVYVSNTPYFAKTGQKDIAVITDIPAGEYTMRVWHPRMIVAEESTSKRVKISASVDTIIEWQLALKSEFKIPRISIVDRNGSY